MADGPKKKPGGTGGIRIPATGIDPESLARLGKTLSSMQTFRFPTIAGSQPRLIDPANNPPARSAGEAAGEVAGGGEEKKPRGRRRRTSTLPILGGKREVKVYPVTEDEMENLGVLSLASSASLSVASFLAAFWLSVTTSVALSSDTEESAASYWQGLSTGAGLVSLALFGLGFYLIYRGHTKVSKIKSGTDHD